MEERLVICKGHSPLDDERWDACTSIPAGQATALAVPGMPPHAPGMSESGFADKPVTANTQLVLSCPLQMLSEDSPSHCSVGVRGLHAEAAAWVNVPACPLFSGRHTLASECATSQAWT